MFYWTVFGILLTIWLGAIVLTLDVLFRAKRQDRREMLRRIKSYSV